MRHSLESPSVRLVARLASVFAAIVVALVMSAPLAQAQTRARVTIDFPFSAAGVPQEAGAYEIEATAGRVILRSTAANAKPVTMLVITRLGRHDTDPGAELVFDKVGEKSELSEIWLPKVDGYLVSGAKGDHEHRVVGGSNPHK
jgi:hypothetical protein